jgi:hypothetical protein
MNLGEMERRLNLIVQDSSLAPEFAGMINDALLEIAADFDLPALKLLTPVSFSVTTDNWFYSLPANYHKNLFRCVDCNFSPVTILERLEDLEALDLDHDETGDRVSTVAVMDTGEEKFLCIYPLANDDLRLWFYQKPTRLVKNTDVPKCIPAEFHERVIFPKLIIKNYQLLLDQVENFDLKPLQYWEGKQREGLYGSAAGPIGFINFLIKVRGGPRRHGGRDPIR